jgi:hypothetical protein
MTYVDDLDSNLFTDDALRTNMLTQISQYGQVPSQLLFSPHPKRMQRSAILEENMKSSENLPMDVIPQQILHLKHKSAVSSIRIQNDGFLVMDSIGRCSYHQIDFHTFDKNNFPCTITISDRHTKRVVSNVTVG